MRRLLMAVTVGALAAACVGGDGGGAPATDGRSDTTVAIGGSQTDDTEGAGEADELSESTETTRMTREEAFHIEYLLSDALPEDWVLAWAVERTGEGEDLPPDYTIVWAPAAVAGATRHDGTSMAAEAPSLSVNSGAAGWLVGVEDLFAEALESAEVEQDEGRLTLRFVADGIPVTVGGDGLSEEQLVLFAEGLTATDHQRWRDALGDRLLIDTGQ